VTWSARLLGLYAALDPYVRITLVDGKGSPDWRGFTRVAHRTIFGLNLTRDGDPVEMLIATLREILDESRTRYARLSELPTERVQEGKLTRDLARDKTLEMPVHLLILEEIQEYLETPDQKANVEIGTLLNSIVKVAPASGVIVLTSTQKPAGIGAGDVARLFNGYRDNHSIRFALRCANRHVSDAVLGGDAYSEGYDASAIPVGKEYRGVGILYGANDDTPMVRTYLADGEDADKVLATARRLREAAGTLSGMAAGDDIRREVRDPLGDTIRVWGAFVDRPGLHWRTLADELAKQLPERYGSEDADSVSALLRGLGVPSVVVSVDGNNQRGCRLDAVREAARRRLELEANNAELVLYTGPSGAASRQGDAGR
jgi:S-DNA-T family DNA segregation ATPase FtsK/SpoIIIE